VCRGGCGLEKKALKNFRNGALSNEDFEYWFKVVYKSLQAIDIQLNG